MRRVAVISDIHGNLPALEAVESDFARFDVEHVINLGDCVSGPLWPAETATALMERDWTHIRGNHDRVVSNNPSGSLGLSDSFALRNLSSTQLKWLSSLPSSLTWLSSIAAYHGSPRSDKEYLLEEKVCGRKVLRSLREIADRLGDTGSRAVVCGHSHIPRIVRLLGGTIVINPGSVGLQAYEEGRVTGYRVENGSPHARYAILELEPEDVRVSLRAVEYDWSSAARKAKREGRMDWMLALETGFTQKTEIRGTTP